MTSLAANHSSCPSLAASWPSFGNWARRYRRPRSSLSCCTWHREGREGWALYRSHLVLVTGREGALVTLVETWWDRGGRLFNCSFCTGQQRDSRARDPTQVLRCGGLLPGCPSFPTGYRHSLLLPLTPSHPAAQNLTFSPIREPDSYPLCWL